MLCLGEKEIKEAVTLEEILDRVESILRYYETGNFHMPLRTHVDYQGNTLLLMPCFTGEAFGTKVLTLFPENVAKGLPMINAVMLLNDAETGETTALLNGQVLTAMRTGAVGGVGVRYLSPTRPHHLGVVGAGVQGFHQALFACAARDIEEIYVFDRQTDKLPAFVSELSRALPETRVKQADTIEDLLENTQTIICATTSNQPVLPDRKDLIEGRHFVGIGSYRPDMQEFPQTLFELVDQVLVDTTHAMDESGDLMTPLEKGWIDKKQVRTMGDYLEKGADRLNPPEGTTLFKSVGMGLFDVGVSKLIYDKALEKGLGSRIEL